MGGFTLTKLRHVGDEEKIIPSSVDTSSPMTAAPPILPQSAFCALKKTDSSWPKFKLDRFKFLILDILSARRVRAELQLESQSEPMGSSGI